MVLDYIFSHLSLLAAIRGLVEEHVRWFVFAQESPPPLPPVPLPTATIPWSPTPTASIIASGSAYPALLLLLLVTTMVFLVILASCGRSRLILTASLVTFVALAFVSDIAIRGFDTLAAAAAKSDAGPSDFAWDVARDTIGRVQAAAECTFYYVLLGVGAKVHRAREPTYDFVVWAGLCALRELRILPPRMKTSPVDLVQYVLRITEKYRAPLPPVSFPPFRLTLLPTPKMKPLVYLQVSVLINRIILFVSRFGFCTHVRG